MVEGPSLEQAGELLSELVACGSVNPGRRQGFGPPYGEERLVELLADRLRRMAAAVRQTQVAPGRPNLIGHFEGADRTRSLLLEAHSDTVEVSDMTVRPFEPTMRDGRLYGRGACDTKGAMAAMLLGIQAVLESDDLPPVDVYFASTCDEERGATGAMRLMEEGFRADAAVVAEPTDLAVVHATKGALRFGFETCGVPAHSCAPDQGVNAIYHMRSVLEVIEDRIAPSLADLAHPLLGPPTISVGVIEGGSGVNVVPASCRIEVDRRLVPGEDCRQVSEGIHRAIEEIGQSRRDFSFACRQTEYYPPFEEDPEGPLAARTADACRRTLGEVSLATAGWSCNAGTFKQAGIPSIVFGPGSIRQAHTQDEFIELKQVVAAARVYAEIIRSFEA